MVPAGEESTFYRSDLDDSTARQSTLPCCPSLTVLGAPKPANRSSCLDLANIPVSGGC
jgi:hypothetical protein